MERKKNQGQVSYISECVAIYKMRKLGNSTLAKKKTVESFQPHFRAEGIIEHPIVSAIFTAYILYFSRFVCALCKLRFS